MLMQFVRVIFCGWLTFGIAVCQLAVADESVFFKNVAVFDGEKKLDPTNVLIVDGKIAGIGVAIQPRDDSVTIDGSGKTLLPGLIDCHVHVWLESNLQQTSIFGVTTVLDMMSVADVSRVMREKQNSGSANDRADMFSAGAAVTVQGGHGTQFGFRVPTLDSAAAAAEFVNARIREGSDYIKLIYEDGSAYGRKIPTLTPEMFATAVATAHAGKKLAVAHVSTAEGAQLAIDNQIDGLVHLFATSEITPELVDRMKSKHVFVVPTATVVSNASGSNLSKMIVNDPDLNKLLTNENLSNLSRSFPRNPNATSSWDILKNNIGKLNAAGVPILAGTDAPNPGTAHGASMHHELQLLVESGLSNEQALAAATSLPAKHFQLNDRGRIALGLRADLLLVEGDPTTEIKQTTQIVGVWKGGQAIDRQIRNDLVAEERAAAGQKMIAATENRSISSFEDDKITAEFGTGWNASTDSIMGGDSTVDMKIVVDGADQSKSSLEISGKTRDQQPAFAGAMFSPGETQMSATDLSAHQGISFWAKGTGEDFQCMLFFQKRGFQPSIKAFTAGNDWKKYEFKIADFDGCDGTDVLGIWFGCSQPGEFKFQIDEVQLEK